jgi:basic membrane protein A
MGLAPYHDFDSQVPQSLKDQIDAAKQGIIDGSISVDPKDYSS